MIFLMQDPEVLGGRRFQSCPNQLSCQSIVDARPSILKGTGLSPSPSNVKRNRLQPPRRSSQNGNHSLSSFSFAFKRKGFKVCVKTRNKPQIRTRPVGPGAKRQPSPGGLGNRPQYPLSAGGAAPANECCAAPPVLCNFGSVSQPFRAGLTFGSRPYRPGSDLRFAFAFSRTKQILL
jgi:hypothetical protein